MARYFERVCGASLDAGRETKEDVISYLLAQIGDPGQVVMVGDTAFDVLGAKVHGIPTIGVTWGYGQVEAMREAGAAALADTPEQLEALLHTPGVFSPAPPQALLKAGPRRARGPAFSPFVQRSYSFRARASPWRASGI
ncbi:MAG: HAD hydrolase-like protein [Evtepia gabavorous]